MRIKTVVGRILPAIVLMLATAGAPALAGTVNCDSYNERRNTCSADTRNGVALQRQLSWNKCKRGVSWGIQDDNRIWVDQGCRGVFFTGVGWSNGGGGGGGGQQRLTCASYSSRRTECPAKTNGWAKMTRQWSNAPCIQGASWGYNNKMIWVDRGCRADFLFGK